MSFAFFTRTSKLIRFMHTSHLRSSSLILLASLILATGSAAADPPAPLQNIVFGSCLNRTEHPMLERTARLPMDLFLFMGDNIYADTTNMAVMRAKYTALKTSTFFRTIRAKAPILATWDDHDLGGNDAGANYPLRHESQKEFFDWLDEPKDSPRRKQEGVYDARIYGPPGRRVQVIMLDTRYFRSPLSRGDHGFEPSGGPYIPNPDPKVTQLGSVQWEWLEGQLQQPAELRLIVTSIQFVAEFCGSEAWANFPREKQRLLDLLKKTSATGVLFLSGDRHWCELSRMPGPGYPLYDLTASSMTQRHPRGTPTPNRYRLLPHTYHEPNVGRLQINWAGDPRLTLQILDAAGAVQIEKILHLSDLRPGP
jgi:alkaline phosphatase D